jgi:hypothetical protein
MMHTIFSGDIRGERWASRRRSLKTFGFAVNCATYGALGLLVAGHSHPLLWFFGIMAGASIACVSQHV